MAQPRQNLAKSRLLVARGSPTMASKHAAWENHVQRWLQDTAEVVDWQQRRRIWTRPSCGPGPRVEGPAHPGGLRWGGCASGVRGLRECISGMWKPTARLGAGTGFAQQPCHLLSDAWVLVKVSDLMRLSALLECFFGETVLLEFPM